MITVKLTCIEARGTEKKCCACLIDSSHLRLEMRVQMLCPIHKLVKGCLQPAFCNGLIDIICKGMPEEGIRTDIDFVSVLTKGQLSQSQNMVLLDQEARRVRSGLGATLCSRRACKSSKSYPRAENYCRCVPQETSTPQKIRQWYLFSLTILCELYLHVHSEAIAMTSQSAHTQERTLPVQMYALSSLQTFLRHFNG